MEDEKLMWHPAPGPLPDTQVERRDTAAFAWLQAQAAAFKFYLSYPRGNGQGYGYEPWHWCWHPERG